ncbi:hypothetical protein [Lentzea sp. E54]|uniref:hypothetical protein n=1 Tax=Lentzea xerophila TaxID=3435883 RepID=UPI003DA6009A
MAITLSLGALLAALVFPATATAAPENTFQYGCTLTLDTCREAGIQAGSSPAAVANYLDTAATEMSALAFTTQYGYLTNNGANGRFYGWKLKKGVNILLNYYRCQVVNGQLVNCVLHGEVGVQASFFFNGHQVREIKTTVTNLTPLPLQVQHASVCLPGGAGCTPPVASPVTPMPTNIPNNHVAPSLYLPDAGAYQVAFGWNVIDPPISSSAATPVYGSIIFNCEQLGPVTDPGECYYLASNA